MSMKKSVLSHTLHRKVNSFMKKTISLILCLSFCLCFLCSCGDVSPYFPYQLPENPEYKVYLSETEYIGVPEYIECTIENLSGKRVAYDYIYLYKFNEYDECWDATPFALEEKNFFSGAKTRKIKLDKVSKNKRSGKIYLEEQILWGDYTYSPGEYKLVVVLSDEKTMCYTDFSILE